MLERKVKATIGALVVSLVLAMAIATMAFAARDNASLLFFEDETRAGGQSSLDRDGAAGTVSAHIKATHLDAGHAYTYWWVVFNNPSACSPPGCGEDDIFNEPGNPAAGFNTGQIDDVGISVIGGNGEVTNNGGRATFTGTLFEGSGLGHNVIIGPGGMFVDGGAFLEDAMSAEIHIVIRNHGPAQTGADLAEQLHTFWGNCSNVPVDDDPTFVCVDEQFAVHK